VLQSELGNLRVGVFRRLAVEPRHIAEGLTEITPVKRLGSATVWVRRHGRSARLLTEAPDLEVPNLQSLLGYLGAFA
jgi:hypothetical protein